MKVEENPYSRLSKAELMCLLAKKGSDLTSAAYRNEVESVLDIIDTLKFISECLSRF
jgi:hypothetical protein